MKSYVFLIFIVLLTTGCAEKRAVVLKEMPEELESNSLSYDLIVLDNGFESWFLSHAKPAFYHDQGYYENWNRRYVQAWNYHEMGFRYARELDGTINYEPDIDYGLEINHKLFYYFMYVENVLRIPLIPDGPKTY